MKNKNDGKLEKICFLLVTTIVLNSNLSVVFGKDLNLNPEIFKNDLKTNSDNKIEKNLSLNSEIFEDSSKTNSDNKKRNFTILGITGLSAIAAFLIFKSYKPFANDSREIFFEKIENKKERPEDLWEHAKTLLDPSETAEWHEFTARGARCAFLQWAWDKSDKEKKKV